MTKIHTATLLTVVFILISLSNVSNAGSPALFLLGDSLLDIGTNNFYLKALGKANFPHYGIDFFNSTPNGRLSNGLNMADFIARVVFGNSVTSPPAYLSLFHKGKYSENRLAKITNFNPRRSWRRPTDGFGPVSLIGRENPAIGINFASAGSAILDTNSAIDQSVPLSEQISQLLFVHGNLSATIGSWRTQLLFAKSPFFISMGNNDLIFFSLARAKLDRAQYLDSLVQSYNDTLRYLYNIGVRKFGIISKAYSGCTPLIRVTILDGNCSQLANDLAAHFNERLRGLLRDMMRQSKGMIYSFGNTFDVIADIYQNPDHYNIKNVKDACCGLGRFNAMTNCHPLAKLCRNRDEYLFFDVVHPTQYAAQQIIETVAFGGPTHATPINWARLASL